MVAEHRFLYLHIPKTGGVSFRQVLVDAVDESEILHVKAPIRSILSQTNESLAAFKLVHGHFSSALIRHLTAFEVIVTLRDPVSRCLSTYNFWRGLDADAPSWHESNRAQIRLAQQHSLAELLELPHPPSRVQFRNMQTRLLAGVTDPAIEVTEEHLQQAIAFLRKCAFVAVNESLELSRMLLCRKFDLYYPGPPQRLNVSRQRAAVPQDVLERVAAANVFDARLIEYVEGIGLEAMNGVSLATARPVVA